MENDAFVYLSVFLVGLGLNLTPCVYPMLSVTVAIFSKNQSAGTGEAFFKALVYVLGMATMYSVLGTVAALTGGLFGQWLQSRWVLLGIGTLIAVLAFSMFGLYRLEAPAWLVSRLGSKRGGAFGLFVSGLLVGIFAAPCVGPPVVALLAIVSSRQDAVFGFLVFFILSLGLGFPYLLLGTFSHSLRRLPRSGVWLVWVERLFGTVLLSFAVFYWLLALRPSLLQWLIPAALILGGIYLGFLQRAGNEKTGFRYFKRTAGCVAIAVAALLLSAGPSGGPAVVWEDFSREGFADARTSGKPVVLDFYADWCMPCHEMDATTYRNPKVIQALEDFRRIKVDVTDASSPEGSMATGEFGIVGVPTLVFYDREGEEVVRARRVGYLSADELLNTLELI